MLIEFITKTGEQECPSSSKYLVAYFSLKRDLLDMSPNKREDTHKKNCVLRFRNGSFENI